MQELSLSPFAPLLTLVTLNFILFWYRISHNQEALFQQQFSSILSYFFLFVVLFSFLNNAVHFLSARMSCFGEDFIEFNL